MKAGLLHAACEVIQASSRERPADRVLREMLKSRRQLSAQEAEEISRAVFSYYRWKGWLDTAKPLPQQIEHANVLRRNFAEDPAMIPDAELVRKVLPAWVHEETAVTVALARALQGEPKVWLRARPGQGRELAKGLGDCRAFGAGLLADTLEYTGSKDLLSRAEFHSGIFELQDLSSQAVGLACAPKPGETWWDACAGEGGKLLHLSALMQNKGLIWCSDRAAWRLGKLRRRAARAGVFNYRLVLWDGGPRLPTKTKFDGILVDAPCSGIGTWHRNPHARWTTTVQDVRELAEIQFQLLRATRAALKPGGKLVYSVCTLARSETLGVVDRISKDAPELEILPLRNPLEPGSAPSPSLWLNLGQHGGNGMFVAAWRKNV
jgi:16S rRNA (cytosine967-C5)-methyltransferase